MNLLNFNDTYSDELSCKLKFKEMRDKQGDNLEVKTIVYSLQFRVDSSQFRGEDSF